MIYTLYEFNKIWNFLCFVYIQPWNYAVNLLLMLIISLIFFFYKFLYLFFTYYTDLQNYLF